MSAHDKEYQKPGNLDNISFDDDEQLSHDEFTTKELSLQDPPSNIDVKYNRYPYCIVWTPLPCITWFLPCIGHTGICTSEGVIHDFAGPYYVSVDDFAFGNPHKYVMLNTEGTGIDRKSYDSAILKADQKYGGENHNIFLNNCHSHVANALNHMKYKGKTNWTMVDVWLLCSTKSKYVSTRHILFTYIGFIIVALIILFIKW